MKILAIGLSLIVCGLVSSAYSVAKEPDLETTLAFLNEKLSCHQDNTDYKTNAITKTVSPQSDGSIQVSTADSDRWISEDHHVFHRGTMHKIPNVRINQTHYSTYGFRLASGEITVLDQKVVFKCTAPDNPNCVEWISSRLEYLTTSEVDALDTLETRTSRNLRSQYGKCHRTTKNNYHAVVCHHSYTGDAKYQELFGMNVCTNDNARRVKKAFLHLKTLVKPTSTKDQLFR